MSEARIGLHQLGLQIRGVIGLGDQPTNVVAMCGRVMEMDNGEEQLCLTPPYPLWELRGPDAWVEQARVLYIAKAIATYLNSGGNTQLLETIVQKLTLLTEPKFSTFELVNWQTTDVTHYAVTVADDPYVYDVRPGQGTDVIARTKYDQFAIASLPGYVADDGEIGDEFDDGAE